MKVWAVVEMSYDSNGWKKIDTDGVKAIYTTKEKAEQDLAGRGQDNYGEYGRIWYEIIEYTLE